MLQRIITGLVLIALAVCWLYCPDIVLGEVFISSFAIFVFGCFLIMFIGQLEFAQFVIARRPKIVYKNGKMVSELDPHQNPIYLLDVIYCVVLSCITILVLKFVGYSLQDFFDYARPHKILANLDMEALVFLSITTVWWLLTIPLSIKYPTSAKYIKHPLVKSFISVLTFGGFIYTASILRIQGYHTSTNIGSTLILSVMMLVWATDSGAYFVGKAIGKHKMIPNVSPNKTVEGLLGGLVIAMLVFAGLAYAGAYGLGYSSNMIALSGAALCTIIISVFGDLIESVFKREAGIKDSGKIFPGHGGMLDRIDSMVASVPMFVVSYTAIDYVTTML